MINIFYNEWKGLLRNKLFIFFTTFFLLSLFLVTFFSVLQNKKQIQDQKEAHEYIRSQWDEIDSTNAHRAAHFGTYIFKPNTILNSLDEGINSVTGVVLRLEGHKQNDVAYSERSQSLEISKFGKFKPFLIFQFMIPLFLIFLSFNSYTSEISSGRLKLLIIQGNSILRIVFGKIFALYSISIILLILTILTQILFTYNEVSSDEILRMLSFFLCYSLYYFIIISLTILLSIIFKNSVSSLSLSLIIWLLWTIFLPKTIGNFTESLYPLPTRFELKENMTDDRSKGIDGHNPSDERRSKLEKEILEKYNVDSISQLPINFSGILLQADEEYGNKVWDKHFGRVYDILKKQKKIYQISGLINPFASIQSLSMATCGTDLIHHLDFLNEAEIYRRNFIEKLNNEYTFISKTGENAYLSNNKFFRSIKDFAYSKPHFYSIFSNYYLDILSIIIWLFGLIVLINVKVRKISIQ